jgi:hypothetical protein
MSNRIIYQAQALFVGNSPCTGAQTGILQIHRVTTVSHSYNIPRQDVNQFGQLAALEKIIIQPPTVSLDFGYHVTNIRNESRMGFYIDPNVTALKNLMNGTEDSKNYWIRVVPEGEDAAGYTGIDGGVFAFGNGYLSSWSTKGAVGQLPDTSVKVEASNISFHQTSSGIPTPAINPTDGSPIVGTVSIPTASSGLAGQVSALQPGQISLDIGNSAFGLSQVCLQSYNISLEMRREPLQCLGSKFPFARLLVFPITVSVDVEANVQDIGTGNLSNLICNDIPYDLTVSLYAPACTGYGALKARYSVKGAKLDSSNTQSSIGQNMKASFKYSAQVGGPQDATRGLFMDGDLV